MAPSKITYLERVEIKNLWGEFDINWQLDPQVNILIGINGSGKTTLLGIIASIFDPNEWNRYDYDKLKVCFNDQNFFQLERHHHANPSNHYQVTTPCDFATVSLAKINTFDISLDTIESGKRKVAEVATELDILLEQLIDDFKGYLLKLRNLEREETLLLDRKIKELSLKDQANHEELQELRAALRRKELTVEEIYYQKDQFLTELNLLFQATHKRVDFDKENALIFHKNGKILTPYQLSSGEKQVLIILLTVVLQEDKPCILLMDEPELSLHLAWQLKLIETIQKLTENCQIIIATHAPGILNKGWRDKITKIEDITSQGK
jgi:ABC-type lipoprotein export system ATPase subunit